MTATHTVSTNRSPLTSDALGPPVFAGFHNLWHYVNFIIYLRLRDKTELTGPEQFVYKCLLARDHRWAAGYAALFAGRGSQIRGASR